MNGLVDAGGETRCAGDDDDDIILMSGLSVAEDRQARAYLAKRAEQASRERLVLAAEWAMERGRAAVVDSKGWPLDPDTDWPLPPGPGAMPETRGSYSVAARMAKSRITRRRNAVEMKAAATFDIAEIDLSDIAVPARAGSH